MTGISKLTASVILVLALVFAAPALPARAQNPEAQEFVQMQLTEQQLKSFIAAQDDLAAISKRIEAAGDKEDPQLDAELESLAKKYGFENFEKLEDVASNIMFVLDITDPKTGEFKDPKLDIQAEIDTLAGDTTLTPEEKQKRKTQLEEEMKSIPTLQFKGNIAIVNKHRQALEKSMQ